MALHAATLFTYLRKAPFGSRLSETQISGINAILDTWDEYGNDDLNCLAYILATAFHETGATMLPVREGFAKSDKEARKILAKYRYSKPDQVSKGKAILPLTGKSYYGRGYVQITWADNYQRLGVRLGIPLHQNPDLALECKCAGKILIVGMLEGLFTGKKLASYFGVKKDPFGARAVVNGSDKASLIAGYYEQFLGALSAASTETPLPKGIKDEAAQPDGADLKKDKTVIGGLTSIVGSGTVGALSAIDSPWAFAAFAVLAIGVWLFLTGRIDIKKRVGV